MDTNEVGQAFVNALIERDFLAIQALLSENATMRLLVPKGPQQESGAAALLGRFVGWFGDATDVELESSIAEPIADRIAIGYRFKLCKPDGWRLIEQHLVADADMDGRLSAIDLLCSGFRPVPEPAVAGVH